MSSPIAPGRYVGKPIKRVNDRRLITGAGRYVDDVRASRVLHTVTVRSPYAHARIRSIDTDSAAASPGVVAVYTGEDIAGLVEPKISEAGLLANRRIERYPLAVGVARYAGDAVAVVVAETVDQARDAAALVEVDYEPLPAVVDTESALKPDAPRVYGDWPSNEAWRWEVTEGDVDAAFARADRIVEVRLVNQRVYAAFIEPRAVLVDYSGEDEMTIWASSQVPHALRTDVANQLGIPEYAIRVIAPDVGGAFGAKGGIYPEYLLAAIVSHHLGRPVKWTEARSESFVGTNHGRDQIQYLRAAVTNDGAVLGMTVDLYSNCGAYNAATTAQQSGRMSTGAYRIRNLRTVVHGVMTNTVPTGAYRGAGRPEAAYMTERLMDAIAHELKLDPADVRRRNFIPPSEFPYQGATGVLYDSGNYDGAMSEALERIGYTDLRRQQADAREAGRYLGIGFAVYCEFAGPAWDSATVRVQPTGSVTVTTGISPHGQGEETTFAQLVADQLGIRMEDVVVRASDTAITPQGIGTFGSRGTSVGGSAVLLATQEVLQKAKRIAANMLEAGEADIEVADDRYQVRGAPDRSVTFRQIATAAYSFAGLPGGMSPGLDATSYFMPDGRTFPFGCHVAVVEVDPDTGTIELLRYLAVDDCGPLLNPMLVEGQVVGGLAQGLGQALQEQVVYDDSGQLLSGTFLDYAVPHAGQMINIETAHTVTPSPFNPLGVKGVGEAGTTGGPPAIVNAAIDALLPFGIRHLDMPLTPERIWRAIHDANAHKE